MLVAFFIWCVTSDVHSAASSLSSVSCLKFMTELPAPTLDAITTAMHTITYLHAISNTHTHTGIRTHNHTHYVKDHFARFASVPGFALRTLTAKCDLVSWRPPGKWMMKTAKEAQKLPDLLAWKFGAKTLKAHSDSTSTYRYFNASVKTEVICFPIFHNKVWNPKKTSMSCFNTTPFCDPKPAVDRWNCLKNRNSQKVSLRESLHFPCIIKLKYVLGNITAFTTTEHHVCHVWHGL